MTDYTKLVHDIRAIADELDCKYCGIKGTSGGCKSCVLYDAADAIEALQADVERLKDSNEELREAQTYIDHYGDRWMTSAKDVPTSAYEHGYADGRDEAEAQLPKRGKWIDDEFGAKCSYCGKYAYWSKYEIPWKSPYCPLCGAKMNDSNAYNALDNAQDGPIITPCRGCSDHDGYGGCKSKGGCARLKQEVQE